MPYPQVVVGAFPADFGMRILRPSELLGAGSSSDDDVAAVAFSVLTVRPTAYTAKNRTKILKDGAVAAYKHAGAHHTAAYLDKAPGTFFLAKYNVGEFQLEHSDKGAWTVRGVYRVHSSRASAATSKVVVFKGKGDKGTAVDVPSGAAYGGAAKWFMAPYSHAVPPTEDGDVASFIFTGFNKNDTLESVMRPFFEALHSDVRAIGSARVAMLRAAPLELGTLIEEDPSQAAQRTQAAHGNAQQAAWRAEYAAGSRAEHIMEFLEAQEDGARNGRKGMADARAAAAAGTADKRQESAVVRQNNGLVNAHAKRIQKLGFMHLVCDEPGQVLDLVDTWKHKAEAETLYPCDRCWTARLYEAGKHPKVAANGQAMQCTVRLPDGKACNKRIVKISHELEAVMWVNNAKAAVAHAARVAGMAEAPPAKRA